ncbi:MAG: TerC family protein [Gemmatimonadetes bacterium]|nr:TerC family protein [Gemmatimonadota bacterium]
MELLATPSFWAALVSVTCIQLALGADNLIIITILAGKLPPEQRPRAIRVGLALAMAFRILLLGAVSFILQYATAAFYTYDFSVLGSHVHGDLSGKAIILAAGGLILIWKGIKELRHKAKGHEETVQNASQFGQVVAVIVGMNLLFSVDSILTVVGMTDIFAVMVGSVVISVVLMMVFAAPIARFLTKNPDFEILGLFIMLLIGFVLFLEGGHVAHLTVNGTQFPYIPQWIVIFILMLMFSVDLYQNWMDDRKNVKTDPVRLHHHKK